MLSMPSIKPPRPSCPPPNDGARWLRMGRPAVGSVVVVVVWKNGSFALQYQKSCHFPVRFVAGRWCRPSGSWRRLPAFPAVPQRRPLCFPRRLAALWLRQTACVGSAGRLLLRNTARHPSASQRIVGSPSRPCRASRALLSFAFALWRHCCPAAVVGSAERLLLARASFLAEHRAGLRSTSRLLITAQRLSAFVEPKTPSAGGLQPCWSLLPGQQQQQQRSWEERVAPAASSPASRVQLP
jgi:hypothetical protein